MYAAIFDFTVAIYISKHGKHLSYFAIMLVSVEFNNQLFYIKIKPPPTRRYLKLQKNMLLLTMNSMEVQAASRQRPTL